jgi:hypothetical protein
VTAGEGVTVPASTQPEIVFDGHAAIGEGRVWATGSRGCCGWTSHRESAPVRPGGRQRRRLRCGQAGRCGRPAHRKDQSEWQIEWQTELAWARPVLANAGLCSCSRSSGHLPGTAELPGPRGAGLEALSDAVPAASRPTRRAPSGAAVALSRSPCLRRPEPWVGPAWPTARYRLRRRLR